jgi:hypothetical protein
MPDSIMHNANKRVARETCAMKAEAVGTGSIYSSTSIMQWLLHHFREGAQKLHHRVIRNLLKRQPKKGNMLSV